MVPDLHRPASTIVPYWLRQREPCSGRDCSYYVRSLPASLTTQQAETAEGPQRPGGIADLDTGTPRSQAASPGARGAARAGREGGSTAATNMAEQAQAALMVRGCSSSRSPCYWAESHIYRPKKWAPRTRRRGTRCASRRPCGRWRGRSPAPTPPVRARRSWICPVAETSVCVVHLRECVTGGLAGNPVYVGRNFSCDPNVWGIPLGRRRQSAERRSKQAADMRPKRRSIGRLSAYVYPRHCSRSAFKQPLLCELQPPRINMDETTWIFIQVPVFY